MPLGRSGLRLLPLPPPPFPVPLRQRTLFSPLLDLAEASFWFALLTPVCLVFALSRGDGRCRVAWRWQAPALAAGDGPRPVLEWPLTSQDKQTDLTMLCFADTQRDPIFKYFAQDSYVSVPWEAGLPFSVPQCLGPAPVSNRSGVEKGVSCFIRFLRPLEQRV